MNWGKQYFILMWVVLTIFVGIPLPSNGVAEERFLMFGRVHDDPVRSIKDRQEFVDYVAKKLSPYGITGGRIMVVEKVHMLASALKEGKVDFFHDSIIPTMMLAKRADAEPILRQWKYGEPVYGGVIVVKQDSGIQSLSDLKGKVLAFEEPHSTSAHILPRLLLEENNFNLKEVKPGATPRRNSIGYIYGADGNSVNLLVTGRVDAAATTLREVNRLKPEIRKSLRIVGKTREVPRLLIAVRKDLDPKIVGGLKEVLVNMHKDPEGKEVLKRQQNTTKIDEIQPGWKEEFRYLIRFVYSTLGDEVDSW